MSSLSTLRSLVRQEMKNMDPNGKVWSDSQVDQAVNDAQRRVQRMGAFQWPANAATANVSVTAGVQESDLPSDFVKARRVRLLNVDLQETVKDDVFGDTSVGQPAFFYLEGTKIGLSPTPSGSGTIDMLYWKSLPTITDSVPCALPDDFDRAIGKAGAYYLLAGSPRYAQAAQQKLAELTFDVADLNSRYRFRSDVSWSVTR